MIDLGLFQFPSLPANRVKMSVNRHTVFAAAALAISSISAAQDLKTGYRATPARPPEVDASAGALVVDGRPTAAIVTPAEPSAEIRFAAKQLQAYVEKMTGAVLPMHSIDQQIAGNRIVLGRANRAEAADVAVPDNLGDEGYLIKTAGRDLFVVGGSDRGTLYGVCGLLEDHLGVRWYVPGDPLGECVPKRTNVILKHVDDLQKPSFSMRWIGRGSDWGIMNRQNGPGETLDAGFTIQPGIYHTQNRLLPHREYFGKCPEYFALVKGERSKDRSCKLCYSNPDVVREVARNMAEMLDAEPDIDLISFSPTDGQLWCECDGCRAMDEKGVPKDQSKSRRSLLFYNALAAELRKSHPEARILVGAYNVYNWPPRDATLKADPMLAVIITHYENYCMAHPVADPDCPPNARYVQLINRWEDLGCAIYYYEYYNKGNWSDLPWPIVHSIKRDMPWYHQQGHQGVYTQFSEDNGWTLFPAYYVAAKLIWNVDADVDALFNEMCDRLFGSAGPAMRDYYDVMEKSMADCGQHFPGHGVTAGRWVFTDDVLDEMGRALRRAHELAGDELIRRRLAKIDLSYEYTCRLMEFSDALQSADTRKPPQDALASAEKALRAYQSLVDEVVGNPEKWHGVVNGKGALLRPFVRSRVDRLQKRIQELKASVHRRR